MHLALAQNANSSVVVDLDAIRTVAKGQGPVPVLDATSTNRLARFHKAFYDEFKAKEDANEGTSVVRDAVRYYTMRVRVEGHLVPGQSQYPGCFPKPRTEVFGGAAGGKKMITRVEAMNILVVKPKLV